jgi:DNA-binding response OmpR family regulator
MKNKILLVEDTQEILTNLFDYLRMEGFEVVTAHNGKEALKQLEHFVPEVVVTDLLMDEMTGFELVKAIRQSSRHRSVKILVFSARPKEEDEEIAQLEIDDYILKPASPEKIIEHIQLLLKK